MHRTILSSGSNTRNTICRNNHYTNKSITKIKANVMGFHWPLSCLAESQEQLPNHLNTFGKVVCMLKHSLQYEIDPTIENKHGVLHRKDFPHCLKLEARQLTFAARLEMFTYSYVHICCAAGTAWLLKAFTRFSLEAYEFCSQCVHHSIRKT